MKVLKKIIESLLCLLLIASCSKLPQGASTNDIVTFTPNYDNKPVIRLSSHYYFPDDNFFNALQKKFPDYIFILDYSSASGVTSEKRAISLLKNNRVGDIYITPHMQDSEDTFENLCDLSSMPYINNFSQSSLRLVSRDGFVYQVPGISSFDCIFYNTKMFEDHAWVVPQTHDEFFALCKEIRKEGIEPFFVCSKYTGTLNFLLSTMCYSQMFKSIDDVVWLNEMNNDKALYKGHFEPELELAKRFADEGLIKESYFTSSVTKERLGFYDEKYAMISTTTETFSYAKKESPDFPLGIMAYPGKNVGESGFPIKTSFYFSIPKYLEKDKKKFAIVNEIMSYIASEEGQIELFYNVINLSNVKSIAAEEQRFYKYINNQYNKNSLYDVDRCFGLIKGDFYSSLQDSVKALVAGASVEECIDAMDNKRQKAIQDSQEVVIEQKREKLAKAEKAFSVLETSYYMADKFREATKDDLAVMLDRGFFRSNLYAFNKGDIEKDESLFVLKGIDKSDYLTTYKITGAKLKEFIENPIINKVEGDFYPAISGLVVKYAPWNKRGSRLLKVSMEDGSEVIDDKIYTISAFPGVIDEKYILETGISHSELGSFADIIFASLKKDGIIKPNITKKVKLVWRKTK